jgi:hypothetical protein
MSTIDPTSAPAAQDAPLDPAVAIEHVGEASAASISAEQLGAPPAKTPPSTSSATAEQTRGRPFAPGQSGNLLGRPRGSRNRGTRLAEALVQGQAEALVGKALEMALAGEVNMLRPLLTTLVPSRPRCTVEIALPEIKSAADAVAASSAVLAACSRGDISPSEASEVMALIATHVRTIEVAAIEERMTALEEKQQHK